MSKRDKIYDIITQLIMEVFITASCYKDGCLTSDRIPKMLEDYRYSACNKLMRLK